MRKIINFILAVVMLASFTACGGTNQRDSKNDQPAFVLTRGSYSEDQTTFSNESTGIYFTVPDGWYIYSDDDMAASFLSGVTGEELAGWTADDYSAQITIPDTAVQDLYEGTNFNLQYENLAITANGLDIDEDQYIAQAKRQLATLDMGYTYSETQDVTICGMNFRYFTAYGETSGLPFTQYLAAHRLDDYMIIIVATTFADHTPQYFFDIFQ